MTFYNLRSAADGFRITKFDSDLNPESSYDMGHGSAGGLPECTCPAGTRPTCRHRQMFSSLMPLVDTAFFWDFEHNMIVDSDGDQVTYLELEEAKAEAMPPLPAGVTMLTLDNPATLHNAIARAVGEREADGIEVEEDEDGDLPDEAFLDCDDQAPPVATATSWRRL